jgi:tetratricopeptide (TPR) repeat protein
MKKLLLAVLLLVITFNILKADDFSDAMIKAKKNLQTAINTYDEKGLLKVRGEFERILQLKKQEWIVNYYLAVVDYMLAYTAMGEKQDKDKLKKYTESGFSNLDKSILVRDDFADSYILRYALNFNRWVYEQDKMADIIAQSGEAKDKAQKLDPENPRFYLMDGMSTFYMPEAFGGGAKKSTPIFEKSVEMFNKRVEKEAYYPDWGKDLTYGYLAMSYAKRDDDGDKKKAADLYEKALKEFPDSSFLKGYVKKQLDEMK